MCKAAAEKVASKHMRHLSKTQGVDLFWLREPVRSLGLVMKVSTKDNVADMMTKPLCGPRTKELRERVGVKANESEQPA